MQKKPRGIYNHWKLAQRILVGLILSHCFILMPVYAELTPYQHWKKQQEQHDLRLAQKANQTAQASQSSSRKITPSTSEVSTLTSVTVQPVRLGEQVKVNINSATAQELSAKLDSIGAKKAQAIVDYRNKHGAFKRISDLKNVKGIGEKIYSRNQPKLTLND